MTQLLTQVTMMIRAADKIEEQQVLFRHLLQLDSPFDKYPSDMIMKAVLYNHTLLICNAILDEFNREFTPLKCTEFADRVNKFRRQIKPVLGRIDKWKDLKNYRNQIIAHNLRIKGISIFDKDDKSISYNAPHTNNEIKLLVELLALITMNIGVEFPELRDSLNMSEHINDKLALNFVNIDLKAEHDAVVEEIRKMGLTMTQRVI